TRVAQMTTQYGWINGRAGFLRWARRDAIAEKTGDSGGLSRRLALQSGKRPSRRLFAGSPPDIHKGEKCMKKLALGLVLGAFAFAGTAQAQIKMGVAGPLTGPNAAFGAQLKNGTDQAVEDVNAAGGIMGQKIAVSYGDDVSDPKQGVSVANKFAGDGIKFVVGHFNSGVTMPASEVYQES